MSITPGQRVRHWRELRGISQVELATRSGLEKTKLCKIEIGTQEVRATELEQLAEALGLSMPEFYGATNEAEGAA